MVGELLINGEDTYNEFGVNMGDKSLDALDDKASSKEYIINNDRTKDGTEYCKSILKMNKHTLTLTFITMGDNQADFVSKEDLFYEELSKGDVALSVPKNSTKVHHLKLKNTTGMYTQNVEWTLCKVGVKFIEPNPRNRKQEVR